MKSLHLTALALMFVSFSSIAEPVGYEVPIEDSTLKPWSLFTVDVNCDHIDGRRVITYNYPKYLSGVVQQMRYEQSEIDPNTYSANNGNKMVCIQDSCKVTFKKIKFNKLALRVYLNQISQTKEEYYGRLEVAYRSIGGEPGGIMNENPDEYCHD